MTTDNPQTDFAALFAKCMADFNERRDRRAACHPANKTALFDALAAAGITRVLVNFDGSGDSGQIEEITAQTREAGVPLPEAFITFVDPDRCGGAGASQNP